MTMTTPNDPGRAAARVFTGNGDDAFSILSEALEYATDQRNDPDPFEIADWLWDSLESAGYTITPTDAAGAASGKLTLPQLAAIKRCLWTKNPSHADHAIAVNAVDDAIAAAEASGETGETE